MTWEINRKKFAWELIFTSQIKLTTWKNLKIDLNNWGDKWPLGQDSKEK